MFCKCGWGPLIEIYEMLLVLVIEADTDLLLFVYIEKGRTNRISFDMRYGDLSLKSG